MIVINIFTTREIAVAIIFAVIFIWLFSKKECRKGFANLLQACCKKVLLIPFALLLIYGALITYGITKLSFRVLSIRIEKKVNYFYEVTTSD